MKSACSRMLELKIPADTRYMSMVRRGVRSLAESAGFERQEVADVEVAVCEAVTNSVVHGSPDNDTAEVVIKCHSSGDSLVIEVEDQSNVSELPARPASCDPSKETGRGVLIMHTLMDECDNCRTENGIKVTMAKQKKL